MALVAKPMALGWVGALEDRYLHSRRAANQQPDVVAATSLTVSVRPNLGCIHRTGRVVDVGPEHITTSASGRTTWLVPYGNGPDDTTNTEAPTASRNAVREEVRLP